MEEKLISFETGKLAKEKGFNIIDVHAYYHINKGYTLGHALCYSEVNEQDDRVLLAPTQGLLQKWLREVHNINVFMNFKPNIKKWDFIPFDMGMNGTEYVKYNIKYSQTHGERRFDTYEEALEEGLQEGLKLIKEKQQ